MTERPMRDEVRFEHLRPHELRSRRQCADAALLPLGALEWHGLQNPLGLDGLKAQAVCCRAARKLEGGVVFPPVVWGVPRDSFDVARRPEAEAKIAEALGTDLPRLRGATAHGGMDVQEQWRFYQLLLRMALEQIAGFGFRSIYVCSGHNPLVHWVRPVGVAFARAMSMKGQPVNIDWGGEFEAAGLTGDHGGRWETSLMMAIEPESIDLEPLRAYDEYVGVACGADVVASSRDQGERWLDACADAVAAEVRWLTDNFPALPPRHQHNR